MEGKCSLCYNHKRYIEFEVSLKLKEQSLSFTDTFKISK